MLAVVMPDEGRVLKKKIKRGREEEAVVVGMVVCTSVMELSVLVFQMASANWLL